MTAAPLLSAERVSIATPAEWRVRTKAEALETLSNLLARAPRPSPFPSADAILRTLTARERVQSTGVGGGVAVPHGALEGLAVQRGALLICPEPLDFEAIDGQPVSILFGLVGPTGSPALHLKSLARIARILRDAELCEALRRAPDGAAAYALFEAKDR